MKGSFRPLLLIGGPGLALAAYALCRVSGLGHAESATAGVTFLCAVWWCTEVTPIAVTALIPFVAFPLLNVLDHKMLATCYGHELILLFLAGFMLSRAAEKSKTHLRISHGMMRWLGTDSQPRLVIGFMLAPAVCSMWISNTATALIMLPVAIAVLDEQQDKKLAVPLLLAVAYGASIGGVTTIVGTPPNAVFVSTYVEVAQKSVDFLSWMRIGLPISALMLIATGFVLTRNLGRGKAYELEDLGPWTPAQVRVLAVIGCTAALWITRTLWVGWIGAPMVKDATVGLAAVVAMFLIPSGETNQEGESLSLLDWRTALTIPWGILLLFGGGLAIAKAFEVSGLGDVVAAQSSILEGFPPVLMIGTICLLVTFLTEITSNTATTTLLMPILGAAAIGADLDPAVFMAPAALSASCAFMLPVATPPNAIVFGSERISIPQMARTGLWLNLIGVVIITAVCYFSIDLKQGLGTPTPASVEKSGDDE